MTTIVPAGKRSTKYGCRCSLVRRFRSRLPPGKNAAHGLVGARRRSADSRGAGLESEMFAVILPPGNIPRKRRRQDAMAPISILLHEFEISRRAEFIPHYGTVTDVMERVG